MKHAAAWVISYIVITAIGGLIYAVARIGSHVHEAAGWAISLTLLAVAVALVAGDQVRKARRLS